MLVCYEIARTVFGRPTSDYSNGRKRQKDGVFVCRQLGIGTSAVARITSPYHSASYLPLMEQLTAQLAHWQDLVESTSDNTTADAFVASFAELGLSTACRPNTSTLKCLLPILI